MFLGPSDEFKPIFGMVWFGVVVLALVAALLGSISLAKAGLIALGAGVFYIVWATGFFRYLLHINVATSLQVQLKGSVIAFASSFAYPLIFLSIFFANLSNRNEVAIYLGAFSVLSMFWLYVLYRRIRLIDDTPSTYLKSAAQGYVELEGKVTLYDGEVVRGPSEELPVMVWYRKYFFTSAAGFILDDERGRCTIDPRDAEVITPLHHYIGIFYRAIYPNETIYVLGYLQTLSKQRTELERKSLVSSKLVEWKRNQFKFIDYFDDNNDGKIDEQEMRTANQAAERKVDDDLENIYLEPATHTITAPNDGRPFILSSIHPDVLIVRYKRAMIFHFVTWFSLTVFSLLM